jgi:hypothetical protein
VSHDLGDTKYSLQGMGGEFSHNKYSMRRLFFYLTWKELFYSLPGLIGTILLMLLFVRYPSLYITPLFIWTNSVAQGSFILASMLVLVEIAVVLFLSGAITNIILVPFELLSTALFPMYWRFASKKHRMAWLPLVIYLLAFFAVSLLILFNFILDYWDFLCTYSQISTGGAKHVFNFLQLQNPAIKSNQFSEWLVKDSVNIRDFVNFVWYSLRASLLGYRLEGANQWFIGLPTNLLFTVTYFVLGYQRMFKTWEILDDDPLLDDTF